MANNKHHPFHPIIYVRGFAATQNEIGEAVADPYMGFNNGSTKARRAWTGELRKFFFESPLVRLMGDHDYEDVYVEGDDLIQAEKTERTVPYRCIVIHRYYDDASKDFGSGQILPIEYFAERLDRLILRLRDKVCENRNNDIQPEDFRVHLVAHSMGGLICRALLQNEELSSPEARAAVDKVFTYATPHNGIDMRIVRNVPGWLSFGDVNNFNRKRMADYLKLDSADDVSVLTNFPAERVFNLVGTNPQDYTVAKGLSSWAVGDMSDGLVRIENATTHGKNARGEAETSPRAFVHRSHSGHFGIVNSEEGYQNLTRFLFGALRMDGILHIDEITLPIELAKALDNGKTIKASYQFEVAATARRCHWQMTRREVRENSAIFRTYDELFPENQEGERKPDRMRSPHLFSLFLDPNKSVKRSKSVAFSIDLNVLVPDYEVDGLLFLDRHYEGGFIYRELILVEAIPSTDAPSGWSIRYGFQSTNPGKPGIAADTYLLDADDPERGIGFDIPVEQRSSPGIKATLKITARPWT